jgi:hypothetical protein
MLMVISNENIVRVYRIFLKITAIGMEGVRKGVVCFTYKSLLNYEILGCGLRVEIMYPR